MEREILTIKKSEILFKLIQNYRIQKKVKIGINETIKAIKSGIAVLVVLANDSIPKSLTESISILCEQQGIKYVYVESKKSLGKACKLEINSISIAIIENKDVDNSKMLKELSVI